MRDCYAKQQFRKWNYKVVTKNIVVVAEINAMKYNAFAKLAIFTSNISCIRLSRNTGPNNYNTRWSRRVSEKFMNSRVQTSYKYHQNEIRFR